MMTTNPVSVTLDTAPASQDVGALAAPSCPIRPHDS
jgi:hypothetical protein